MVDLFACGFYLLADVCLIFLVIRELKKGKEPSEIEILLGQQKELFSHIDVTLIGIDCRLVDIQEKLSGGEAYGKRDS